MLALHAFLANVSMTLLIGELDLGEAALTIISGHIGHTTNTKHNRF